MDFYYPNFINEHWRIEGQIFFNDRNHFVDTACKRFKVNEIITFCQDKGIAFFDTASAIRRLQDNASDKYLEVVEQTDIRTLLAQLPMCQAIVTTGEKATETICQHMDIPQLPKVNSHVPIPHTYNAHNQPIILYRLPSSSRAYPLAFDKKVAAYRQMFEIVFITHDDMALPS